MVPGRLFVKLKVSLIREDISCLSHSHYVAVLVKLFVRDGAMVLSLLILVEVKLHQISLGQRGTCNGVLFVFLNVWNNGHQVKNNPLIPLVDSTVGVFERLHGKVAIVEGSLDTLVLFGCLVLLSLASPLLHVLGVGDPHLVLGMSLLAHFIIL